MAEIIKKQFLDYEGLKTLWAKIQNADAATNAAIATLKSEVDDKFENLPEIPTDYSKVDGLTIQGSQLKLTAGTETVGAGVDITSFVADSMLDDIDIVDATEESPIEGATSGKFIKFTWNLAAGSKVKYLSAADLCSAGDLGELITKVAELEASYEEFDSEFEAFAANVQSTFDTNAGLLNGLRADLTAAEAEITALKAATGSIAFHEITKDPETDKWIGNVTVAPTTSSVVSALNELKELIPDVDDYYTKKEIDDMFGNIEEQISVISSEDILGLGGLVEGEE